jgi:hypothetical protein
MGLEGGDPIKLSPFFPRQFGSEGGNWCAAAWSKYNRLTSNFPYFAIRFGSLYGPLVLVA